MAATLLKKNAERPSAGGGLQALLNELDQSGGPIPLKRLTSLLKSASIQLADVARWVKFGSTCYRRNLIHARPHFQMLALCWRSGQRSPIHDHHGSACALKVLRGEATETIFELSPAGLIFPTVSHRQREGTVCGSFDADIHQMGNLRPAGEDLVTLHIYSPPLLTMRTYVLGDAVIGEDDHAVRAAIRARVARMGRDFRPARS